mmetsp:Transcript_27905/g.82032  ORF Transcript_27905/g.82032 Transcript_27905/m.82032 type:complete len:491 (+) Transcript_27905:396-1868(+)
MPLVGRDSSAAPVALALPWQMRGLAASLELHLAQLGEELVEAAGEHVDLRLDFWRRVHGRRVRGGLLLRLQVARRLLKLEADVVHALRANVARGALALVHGAVELFEVLVAQSRLDVAGHGLGGVDEHGHRLRHQLLVASEDGLHLLLVDHLLLGKFLVDGRSHAVNLRVPAGRRRYRRRLLGLSLARLVGPGLRRPRRGGRRGALGSRCCCGGGALRFGGGELVHLEVHGELGPEGREGVGLGEIVVHARLEALGARVRGGVGREGDDGHAAPAPLLLHASDGHGGVEAVHDGHVAIHEDHVDVRVSRGVGGGGFAERRHLVHCGAAVVRCRHLVPKHLEHVARNVDVVLRVVRGEHVGAAVGRSDGHVRGRGLGLRARVHLARDHVLPAARHRLPPRGPRGHRFGRYEVGRVPKVKGSRGAVLRRGCGGRRDVDEDAQGGGGALAGRGLKSEAAAHARREGARNRHARHTARLALEDRRHLRRRHARA